MRKLDDKHYYEVFPNGISVLNEYKYPKLFIAYDALLGIMDEIKKLQIEVRKGK